MPLLPVGGKNDKKEVINDLYFLEKVLHKHFCISTPACLKYAIEYLESAEAVKEVIELKEEDFYEDLPFWMKEEDPNV